MPQVVTIKMRYPGGDPENGPAFPQRWNGDQWECAEHKFKGGYCRCGMPQPPDVNSTSHSGQHNDANGPFEVFWHDGRGPDDSSEPAGPGWYWWSCHPGCLPDGEAQGPYATSKEAYDEARSDNPNRDGVRLVEGDDLWEGAVAGWYVFKGGDSTGPFDTEEEAYDATNTDAGSGGPIAPELPGGPQ